MSVATVRRRISEDMSSQVLSSMLDTGFFPKECRALNRFTSMLPLRMAVRLDECILASEIYSMLSRCTVRSVTLVLSADEEFMSTVSALQDTEAWNNVERLTLEWDSDAEAVLEPITRLPPQLRHLKCMDEYGAHVSFELPTLPASLESIDLSSCHDFDGDIRPLPPALKVLKLGGSFDMPLGPLPPSLQVLELDGRFNHPLGPLPPGLEDLIFVRCREPCVFDQTLGPLPASLKRLHLSHRFNQPLGLLPSNLESLELFQYNHPLTPLPPTLARIVINSGREPCYAHRLDRIPPTLKEVTIAREYRFLTDFGSDVGITYAVDDYFDYGYDD
ncbi:hypothetical protein JKP88DRAFT_246103 [Tribonema minus]|uniref:Uncharacterized protein n=1 Tax=Tribonema minus TaxID=303371 RepID=A0A836CFA4_9STRA|nr:hypothetical protein JKP88DRAFT_246103 [Tribonema minus]